MEFQNLHNNIILAKLASSEMRISDELKELNEKISQKKDCDLVLDFSNVEIINSSNISNLLILRGILEKNGHNLFLCHVKMITRCIFVVAGLTELFIFIDNTEEAIKSVQTLT
jgi:anti-anti-sigma factor